jgi:hypothetical protein
MKLSGKTVTAILDAIRALLSGLRGGQKPEPTPPNDGQGRTAPPADTTPRPPDVPTTGTP